MISCRPLMNSDRFPHFESTVYARHTFSGAREFQPSSAPRTFRIALSLVNGGKGGRGTSALFAAPAAAAFGSLIISPLSKLFLPSLASRNSLSEIRFRLEFARF